MFQRFEVHAVVVSRDFDPPGLEDIERHDSAEVCGAFTDHGIPLVDKQLGEEVQPLLRTGGHKDFFRVEAR